MADSLPSPTPFKLPEDVHLLARLRDQLDDYLSTLERNTDSINGWLTENQNDIIVRHHQLVRAITHDKSEAKTEAVLNTLGELAGFVLNLQDFEKMAAEQFGKDNKVVAAIAAAPRGFPAHILEELPEITMPEDSADVAPVAIVPVASAPAEPEQPKKGFWSSVSGWFKGKDPEEEAREQEAAVRRQWRNVRSELVSLQSDRHYYIDSFMDWVGENLEPENPGTPPAAALMEQYQNPQYVIDLAQRDYAEVNEGKTRRLAEQSLNYSRIARTFDAQHIDAFIQLLPSLFPKKETQESKQLKTLLLTDYNVASFAELALTHVKDRKDQLALLSAALTHETKFEIAGLKSGAQIFERVLGHVLDAEPLDSSALQLTIEKLKKYEDEPARLLDLSAPHKTVFKRIEKRFGTDYAAVAKAIEHVFTGLTGRNSPIQPVVDVVEAATSHDMNKLARTMGTIQAQGGHAFMAMWHLTYPEKSIVGTLTEAARNNGELSWIMESALKAGILDELKGASHAATGSTQNVIHFIGQKIIPSLATDDPFSCNTARQLIAFGFAHGGLDHMRTELTKTGGWLESVASSPALNVREKLQWTAALLEPFASDVVKANILHEAAGRAHDTSAAQALGSMEAAFTGNNIRLGDDKILTNLDRIANVWYNPDPQTLRFTVNGTGHTLMEGVSPHMARETLALLQRKGTFESEYDGLFNADNIDRVVSTAQGPKISWYRHTADLNVTEEQLRALHRRKNFLHEDDPETGNTFSINQRSVTLLQPLEDGTHLLIDKYGSVMILEGKIRLEAQKPLLDLGGVYFNPENASIISLRYDKDSIDIRCESKEFDDFLDKAAPGEYFYNVPLPYAAEMKAVEKALLAHDATRTPGGTLDSLFFNLSALGFMMYEEDGGNETGFHCHKYGPARKHGFINTEGDLARTVFDGLSQAGNLFTIRNVITHKSMIDDAYYNAEKELFYLVIGQDILTVPCDEETAYDALSKLAQEPGFEVVGANYIENPKKPGVGIVEMPADVVNLDRATMLAYNAAQKETMVTADTDKFPVSLDQTQAQALFDKLESAGQEDAKRKTKAQAWTHDLKASFVALPRVDVLFTPSITDMAPAYLLKQANYERAETRATSKINADFAIAAAPVKTNEHLSYPVTRTYAPAPKRKYGF